MYCSVSSFNYLKVYKKVVNLPHVSVSMAKLKTLLWYKEGIVACTRVI